MQRIGTCIRRAKRDARRAHLGRGALLATVGGAILLLAGCGGSTIPSDSRPPITDTELKTTLETVRREYGLPALAAAVVRSRDGSLVASAVGRRKATEAVAVTPADRFGIGSCAKAMTATLIATLVAEGRLEYGRTLAQMLPDRATAMSPAYRTATLEQVLRMRAGLPAYTDEEELATLPPLSGTDREKRAGFVAYVLSQPPAGPVGTELYSNVAYVLLAHIAERVTGRDWDALMQERIFGPLRMTGVRTGPPALGTTGQPWGHVRSAAGASTPVPPEEQAPMLWAAPAGLVSMPVTDWGRFAQAHLRGIHGSGSGLSLNASQIRALHEGGSGEVTRGGWSILPVDGQRVSAFTGSDGSFDSLILLFPDSDLALVAVTNASADEAQEPTETQRALIDLLQRLRTHAQR